MARNRTLRPQLLDEDAICSALADLRKTASSDENLSALLMDRYIVDLDLLAVILADKDKSQPIRQAA